MTSKEMKQRGEALILIADGKWDKVQFLDSEKEWTDYRNEDYAHSHTASGADVRPKPMPKTRKWSKPQDIPGPGPCYVKQDKDGYGWWSMVLGATDNGVLVARSNVRITIFEWDELDYLLWSSDLKTWHKCEVTEEAP